MCRSGPEFQDIRRLRDREGRNGLQAPSPKGGLQHHCVAQSQDEATKVELIAVGVGAAMLERSEAEQAQQAQRLVIWETEPMYSELHFACLTTRQDDPLIRVLWSAVQEVWKTPQHDPAPVVT